jgi:hypothetical protein
VRAGVDKNLRDRVAEEIERFTQSLSAAEKDQTPQNLEALADAADRLMRAIGRVLIETKRALGDAKP